MAKISDEVKSFFLGDTTGLERAVGKATNVLDTYGMKERQIMQDAKRAFDSRAGVVKNALVSPTAAATDGLNKLVKTMGFSAVTTGALGAGVALAADKLSEFRSEALAARKETEAFTESYRRFSQGNRLVSGAEDSGSLIGKLNETREQEFTLKDRRAALHPDTEFGRWQLMNRYNMEQPGHGVENLQRDIGENKLQITDNGKTQFRLQKSVAESLAHTVELTKEQLHGSVEQARIKELELSRTREIRALEATIADTDANKSAINERFNLQIAKEKELATLRDKQFTRDSQAIGIGRQLVSDEQRRVNLLQLEADGVDEQLRTRQFTNDEEHQALLLRSGQLKSELVDAKTAASVAASQVRLVQQTTSILRTNTSLAAQRLGVEQATLATLREQLSATDQTNTSRAEGIKASIAEHENAVRLQRQDFGYGKSNGQIQRQITRDRTNRINRDKFDARQERDDGLLLIHRDGAGNAIDGFDPILGKRRPVTPGKGRAEQGFHTGGLETGGLSTSGTTGSLFGGADLFAERHKALVDAGKIDRASVSDKLADPTKYGFGDPIKTMNAAPMWPDLAAKMKQEFAGGYRIHPDSQAKLDRVGDALTNSQGRAKLGEQRQYSNELVRQMKEQIGKGVKPGALDGRITGMDGTIAANRDIKSSHSVAQASMKIQADQLTALAASNELLGKVVTGITYLTQNWGFA